MSRAAQLLSAAVGHHQAGRLAQAEQGYRQILAEDPRQPDALHLLGLIAHQQGRHAAAVESIGRAIELNPNVASFHSNLALAQRELGKLAAAVASCRSAVRLDPRLATAHYNLGCVLSDQRDFDEAERCFRRALELAPNHLSARKCLGDVLVDQGRLDEAEEEYGKAIAQDARCAAAHFGLGNVRVKQGRPGDAVEHYRQAVACKPDHAEAYDNLGNALAETFRFDEAAAAYGEALRCKPALPEAHNNLGVALTNLGRLAEAVVRFREALALRPDYAEAQNNLGNALKDLGDFSGALAAFDEAIALNPFFAEPYANKVECRRYGEADREEIDRAERIVADSRLSDRDRCCLHFALGKMHDDRGEWDAAFEHYRQGNQLKGVRYDDAETAAYFDSLIETFDSPLLAHVGQWGEPSTLPIFVVGMPRSATTLVEQILASHPAVHGSGESRWMAELVADLPEMQGGETPYPRCAASLDADTTRRAARRYLHHLEQAAGGAIRVTDKTPHNFLHLGLIALLMPGAKIVHCRRDPMDTCLSCYFQNFHQPLSYAYDLESLAAFFGHYARLMDHWRRVLPVEMFEVDYEDLAENQEAVSRRLVEYCGLHWHPDCLDFSSNRRPVQTASKWQVRQPLYRRAVGRWRNYEAFLEPLKRGLQARD